MAGSAGAPKRMYRVFVEMEVYAADPDEAKRKADEVLNNSPDDRGWSWSWEIRGPAAKWLQKGVEPAA